MIHSYTTHPNDDTLKVCEGCGKTLRVRKPNTPVFDLTECTPNAQKAWSILLVAKKPKVNVPEEYVEEYEPSPDAKMPSGWRAAFNFLKASKRHFMSGGNYVTEEQYKERMKICTDCPAKLRINNRCSHKDCGCFLSRKLGWASESCPMGFWLSK